MTSYRRLRPVLIGVLIIAVLASGVAFLSSQPSGLVIGIPQTCKAAVNFAGPASLDLAPGEIKEVQISITKVTCGISYVRLALNGIPGEFYSVGPKYIPAIAPVSVPREFTLYFDIPPDAEGKSYTGIYTIYTNEGTYTFGELIVNVGSIEKPRLLVETRISKQEVPEAAAVLTWYGIVFFASLVTLVFVGYEYFVLSKKREFSSALKREESGIYRAIGKAAPSHKPKFESALKKAKKRR